MKYKILIASLIIITTVASLLIINYNKDSTNQLTAVPNVLEATPTTPSTELADITTTSTTDTMTAEETKDTMEDIMDKNTDSETMTTAKNEAAPVVAKTPDNRTMLVAGGCFWCVESDLEKLPGVQGAVSGYAGGTTENPTYKNYSKGGHKEVVEVSYDANVVSFREIAIYAIKHMDPTDGAGSFYDRGVSYGPALYFETAAEQALLTSLIASIDQNGPYEKPLAVAILKRPTFFAAEDYHQDYYKGTLSSVKYKYYRNASGRDAFIEKNWGSNTGPTLPWEITTNTTMTNTSWRDYQKPDKETLKQTLDPITFKVTQEEGTERAGTSPLDKEYGRGIYVDILSGEPLFSSRDKFDSGTGWPSFTDVITKGAVTEHEDNTFFSTRTEIRSAIADNHLGHVFPDGPRDRGGLRYCMNGVALRFIPEAEMASAGYTEFLTAL